MGEIGIDRKEVLYALKIWEINAIISGYRKREVYAWRMNRWQTFLILRAIGAKIDTQEDLLELPGDCDHEDEELSEEEYEASMELIRNANRMIKP